MNKSLLSLGLVAVLGMCSLSANEVDCKKPNNQEMEFLFGTNAKASDINVAVLSDEEMKEVQGEAFFATLALKLGIGVGIGAARYAYCKWSGGNGCSFNVNVTYPLN